MDADAPALAGRIEVGTRRPLHRAGRLYRGGRSGDRSADRLEAQIEAALAVAGAGRKGVAFASRLGAGGRRNIGGRAGDITCFANPRQFMAYLSLVPSEHSSGKTRCQGGITKAGIGAARRMLIEAAWSSRFPARISRDLLPRQESLAKPVRDIAWKAQERLCRRYRKRTLAGKPKTVVTAAIAFETTEPLAKFTEREEFRLSWRGGASGAQAGAAWSWRRGVFDRRRARRRRT